VITPTLAERILRQPWPGNVRELANACELAVEAAAGAARIEVEHWPVTPFVPGPVGCGLHAETTALEGRRLREALALTHGNKTQAARALGLSRQGFLQKLRRHGLGTCATLDDDRAAD
jgi:transcriptional regulator of acetoin/glycerol metabolism